MEDRIENRGLTRGGLMKVGAVAALAMGAGGAGRALAGTAGAGLAASGLKKPSGGPAYLRHATFAPLVGTDFRVRREGARFLRVKLIEARESSGAVESFSLLFRGRARSGVEAGTYRFEHPSLGGFELFASPVGRGVKGLDLEAVINKIAT
jgi:hypothetical protein